MRIWSCLGSRSFGQRGQSDKLGSKGVFTGGHRGYDGNGNAMDTVVNCFPCAVRVLYEVRRETVKPRGDSIHQDICKSH